MVRPADQQMTTIEKMLCTVPRERSTWGSTGVGQEAEGARGSLDKSFIVVSVDRTG